MRRTLQGVDVVNKDTNDIYETIETFTPNMLNTRNGVLTANVNYTLDSSESSIAVEALTIASNIHIGYEYASTFSSEDFGTVTVNYPSQSSAEAKKAPKTDYNPITNEINVDRLITNLGVDSYYNTIDTLLHEYGHRVQDFLNIEDNPGGSHALNENASDTFYEQKSYTLSYASRKGEKLGYAEGWATAFSLLAQSYFSSEYTTTNIPYFNDNKFYAVDYSNDNVSTAYVSTGGEASEYQVARFLYNIVDIDKGVLNDDLLNISHSKFWSLSTKNKPKTFAEFYQNCLDGGLSPNSMGILLGKFNIAPSNLANKDSSTNSPKITWTRGGGKHYQNNQFIIKFYDEKGYIKRTVNTTSCPYTLTPSDISFIKSLPGSSYYIQVAGSNSYTIDEMYYNSNVKTLSKPSIAK